LTNITFYVILILRKMIEEQKEKIKVGNLDHVLTKEYQKESIASALKHTGGYRYDAKTMYTDNVMFICRNWKRRKEYTCRVAIKASVIRLKLLKEMKLI
jgi:hypothetical protein